jgi:hypothetical protein
LESECEILWRLDKDEVSGGFSIIKDNLIKLFIESGDERRRKLIVELEPPRFQSFEESLEDYDDSRQFNIYNIQSINIYYMQSKYTIAEQPSKIAQVASIQTYEFGSKESSLQGSFW